MGIGDCGIINNEFDRSQAIDGIKKNIILKKQILKKIMILI
jgi:hypothetical protein